MFKAINKQGFTLIELLVVIGIIGLISTLAVISLSGTTAKARDAKRMADIVAIRKAIDYYLNTTSSATVWFPGGDSNDRPVFWDNGTSTGLNVDLDPFIVGDMPTEKDPTKGTYFYCVNLVTTPKKYLVGAVLEQDIDIPGDLDGTSSYTGPSLYCLSSYPTSSSPYYLKLSSTPNCDDNGNGTVVKSGSFNFTGTVFCLGSL